MVFWPFLWFWPKHENGQKSIFSLEKWKFFLSHKIQVGRPKFFSFYIFDLVKKSGQKWKKITFVHGPFLQFLAQKCQKYPFSWKNPFLRFVLWVISERKCFLHFSRKWVFVPARAIFLRTVRYWVLRMWELCIWCKIK